MALQRETSPIPPGRYWMIIQDLPEGQMSDFNDWLRDVSGSVTVEASDLDKEADPQSQFVIFKVTGPGAFLEARQFGFPTIAKDSISTREDAVNDEKINVPGTAELLQRIITAGKLALIGTLGILAIKALRK